MFRRKIRPKAQKAKDYIQKILNKLPSSQKHQENAAPVDVKDSVDAYTPPCNPEPEQAPSGLRVTVTARFKAPIEHIHTHTYETSPDFVVTEKLCAALLRRINHCSNEMVTRWDPEGARPLLRSRPHIKKSRYNLIFQIERDGRPWAQQHFPCYPLQPLDEEMKIKVISHTDTMIGMFLYHHDSSFQWEMPPIVRQNLISHATTKPAIGCPQSLACIPSYSGKPGYSIYLSLKTQHRGQNRNWASKIDSLQNSPLTLCMGEYLMAKMIDAMQHTYEQREAVFDDFHMDCNGQEGTNGCEHYDSGAFQLTMSIRNNIGPDYAHLSHKIQTFQLLFTQDQIAELEDFIHLLEDRVLVARDDGDLVVQQHDDLKVQVQCISGKDWSVKQPFAVSLDKSVTESRATIEATLERVRTGIKQVIQDQAIDVAVTAHKRGHLILDTFIQAKDTGTRGYGLRPFLTEEQKMTVLRDELRERIQQDITAVCRDTWSLDEVEEMKNLKITTSESVEDDDDEHESRYTATPPPRDISLTQRRIVKKPRTENLRLVSGESQEQAEEDQSEDDEISEFVQDYGYMADMVSVRSSATPAVTPSLADTDSIIHADGAVTPATSSERREPFPSHWRLGQSTKQMRSCSGMSCVSRTSSGSYMEEPSVIHHSSHLGDATLRLLENLGEAGNVEEAQGSRQGCTSALSHASIAETLLGKSRVSSPKVSTTATTPVIPQKSSARLSQPRIASGTCGLGVNIGDSLFGFDPKLPQETTLVYADGFFQRRRISSVDLIYPAFGANSPACSGSQRVESQNGPQGEGMTTQSWSGSTVAAANANESDDLNDCF